ncbi:putative response regulatory protein [Desulfomarina profundi]|uniref:Response regulatory protein n=1 Tax=Desulfomarina profundi TaxID=2772557 RepID=A0A8D5JNT7_9BACT|nr:two-component system response regulator BtsR [Desulfomarina profundi]BCL63007.1 putative response regulatory protein [Desulfomarina profundi]
MIRTLIVDDELHAREEMEILLRETGACEIVATCGNAIEALKIIKESRPEVIFLDIQMPVIGGFELLSMIDQSIMPHVVFVTAYDEYTLKAFEEKTLDYLLKPVEKSRLDKTIAKLLQMLRKGDRPRRDSNQVRRIPCVTGHTIKILDIRNVEYVYSGPGGVFAVTPEGEFYTELTLKTFEEKTDLFRCHKQYLINLVHLDEMTLLAGGGADIRTATGSTLPVSRRYLKKLKRKLMI